MPNVPVEPAFTAGDRAPEPALANRVLLESIDAVVAHGLLNSSSVVLLGAASLDEQWDSFSPAERRDIAARIHRHAESVSAGLKHLTRSGVPLVD